MGSVNAVSDRPRQGVPASSAARRHAGLDRGTGDRSFELSLSTGSTIQKQRDWNGQMPVSEAARQRTLEELRTLVRAVQLGETDPERLADLIFYARHPDAAGDASSQSAESLVDEWNDISALLVHPVLNEMGNLLGADQLTGASYAREGMPLAVAQRSSLPGSDGALEGHGEKFDDIIARAVEWCPGLSPSVLKGLLAQESGFDPTVINKYGYAGIAQIGRDEAREAGLYVGIAGSRMDERLNPYKAIPATARLLNMKAQRLGESAFSRYGQPAGVDFWNFVLAAYNGGEATVALAMGHAHREGLALARANSLVGNEAVSFARRYASRWDNLLDGGSRSPLARAVSRYFPDLAPGKFREISSYPKAILARSLGHFIGPR